MVARIAERFHVLPSAVARDLEEDPDQLSARCLTLLDYATVKRAEESSRDQDDLKPWKGPMLELVLRNKFDLHKEKVAAKAAAAEKEPLDG